MLELKHIRKSFDGVTILEDINLTIGDGEIVSILGPSGCRENHPAEPDPWNHGRGQRADGVPGTGHHPGSHGGEGI